MTVLSKRFRAATPLAVLFVVFSFFPAIVLVEITNKGSSIRLYHVLGLLCLTQLVIRKPLCLPSQAKLVWIYFITAVLSNFLVYWQAGFSNQFIQLPFAFLTFILGFHLIRYFGSATLLNFFSKASKLYLVVVALKTLLYIDRFAAAAIVGQGAFYDVPWVSSGGPNIEATFCGIAAIFLIKDRRFFLAIGTALVVSLLYQSRSGFVVCAIALFCKRPRRLTPNQLFLAVAVLALLAVVLIEVSTLKDNIVTRFLSIGSELDDDAVGRALLWTNGFELLMHNPFGNGIGNSFHLLEGQIGRTLLENNFHNIYLQNTIDGGIQSGILFATLMAVTVTRAVRSKDEHKIFGVALLAYAVTGFFQFVGYDVFGWLMIGICVTLNGDERRSVPNGLACHRIEYSV